MSDLYPSVKIGSNLYLRNTQALQVGPVMNALEGFHFVDPLTSIANNTSIASTKKITFEVNQPGHISSARLKLEVEETSGTDPVTLERAHSLIERIEVLGADNRVIQTLDGDECFYLPELTKSIEQVGKETYDSYTAAGYASDYATITIAAGASATYYIDLPVFFALAHVDTNNSGCRLEVHLKSNNVSGSGNLAINNVQMVYESMRMTQEHEYNYRRNVLGKGSHCFKYPELNHVLSQPITLTSGGTFKYRLDSATSNAVALVVLLRPSATTSGTNLNTYRNIASLQLEDSSGRIIGNPLNSDMLRLSSSGSSGYYFTLNPDAVVLGLGDINSAVSGNEVGGFQFSGSEYLEFTNGISTGSHVLDVYALEVKQVYQSSVGRIMDRQ